MRREGSDNQEFDRRSRQDWDAAEPVVSHVEVRTRPKEWRPSTKIIDKGIAEGWLTLDEDIVTLITAEGEPDVKYKVIAPPGYYCCHDGEPLPGEKEAQAYVKQNFAGKDSPSKQHPAGYARHNFYMLERLDG